VTAALYIGSRLKSQPVATGWIPSFPLRLIYLFFLARPSCNCHRLCLHNIAVTDNELVTRLQGLPSLTIYRISRESVTDGHRARMTHDISGSSVLGSALLVPSLKQLNCITQFGLDDQIILDVVQSRWKPSKYNI
jgi:hypothetical protein